MRFCWGGTPVMRFYRSVLRSITPVLRFCCVVGVLGTAKDTRVQRRLARLQYAEAALRLAGQLLFTQSFESGRVKWKPHYTPRTAQYA